MSPDRAEVSVEPRGWGAVIWSDLDEPTADREIDDQLRYFAGLDRSFEWKLYDGDRPRDLPNRLQAKGFTQEATEALMIAGIEELDATRLDGDPAVTIVPVLDRAGMDLAQEVAVAAFGRGHRDLGEALLNRIQQEPEVVSVILAMAGERAVGVSRTEVHPGTGFASLWGGGVVPDWRGRGIYRAMVGHRARAVRVRGYRYLRVDALPTSEPILTRLGFVRAGTTTPYQSPDHPAG